jgi:hypothetical protein
METTSRYTNLATSKNLDDSGHRVSPDVDLCDHKGKFRAIDDLTLPGLQQSKNTTHASCDPATPQERESLSYWQHTAVTLTT